jgi:hypothetical protein
MTTRAFTSRSLARERRWWPELPAGRMIQPIEPVAPGGRGATFRSFETGARRA